MKPLADSEKALREKQDGRHGAKPATAEIDDGSQVGVMSQVVNGRNAGPTSGDKGSDHTKEKKPRDLMTIFTGLLVVVGFLTVILMGVQSCQNSQVIETTSEANKIARQNFENSQRAWLAPIDVVVTGDFTKPGPARVTVNFTNFGREPASRVRKLATARFAREGQVLVWPIDHCVEAKKSSDENLIVYPSEKTTYSTHLSFHNDEKLEGVLNGKDVFYVKGCFVYSTFESEHFSRFCFHWIHQPDVPMNKWEWRFCPQGNEAD